MSKEFYSVKEVADLLGVSSDHVQGLIRQGDLIAYRVGAKAYRIKKEDLDTFLEQRRTKRDDVEKRD